MIKSLILSVTMAFATQFGLIDGDDIVVERIENGVATLEIVENGESYHVSKTLLEYLAEEEVFEGEVLTYSEGSVMVNKNQTEERLKQAEELLEMLKNR